MSDKKIALVTGASSGIGKATAQILARDGFHVLLHFNKNVDGAQQGLDQITEMGGTGELISFDVKNSEDSEKKLEGFFAENPDAQIAALVNCAGIHIDGMAGLMSDEDFDRVQKTNLYGPFYLMRWALKRMIRQRSGSIVNVSSLAGQTGNAGQINYAASKAGLIAMTKTLAMEIGKRGVRVNAVSPGLIETDMLNDVPGLDQMIKRVPLGRLGQSSEVGEAISFLCSEKSSYITGHTLSINGGLFPS